MPDPTARPLLRPGRPVPRPLGQLADLLGVVAPDLPADQPVTGLSMDSRAVAPGDVYAGVPGAQTHGARFAADAAAAGAVALLTDAAGAERAAGSGLPVLVVGDVRSVVGRAAAWAYGDPARHLLLLGVTGTNGKTTTTYLLDAVLRRAYGASVLIGTVETRIGDERVSSVRTTPEAPEVQALLAVARERGVRAGSLEVSSHALALGRIDGTVVEVAGFTNLSQDHLDFHPTMDDYFAAKAGLFTPERSRRGVVCVDDAWGRRLAAQSAVPVSTLATTAGGDADWTVRDREVGPSGAGTAFVLAHRDGRELRLRSPLAGEFNVANTALAAAMAITAGVEPAWVAAALAAAEGPPGRLERVQVTEVEPLALVDYAHSPDALELVLAALRRSVRPDGRLVVVVGAGGDRDRGKRPAMGEVAARLADLVVVTDDNPRSEDPAAIRAALLDGTRTVPAGERAEVVEVGDRGAAVRAAVEGAGSRDVVLVAGKGHEQGQEVAGVVHPFDDRVALRTALQARAGRRDPDLHDLGVPLTPPLTSAPGSA